MRIPPAVLVLGIALILDISIREWPEHVHPVVIYGAIVAHFDRDWKRPTLVGILIAGVLPLLAAVIGGLGIQILLQWNQRGGILLGGFILFSTISLQLLLAVGKTVSMHIAKDLDSAREDVSALVGRDAETLGPVELYSAIIESLAENLCDGFIAPLFAFVVGSQISLSVGVAAAIWIKAVNTLDSMLGYHHKPVGWASARLDDIVMWVPARVTAVLIGFASLQPRAPLRAREWSQHPLSPNAGWPMATMAVVLGVELRKPDEYVLHSGARQPTGADTRSALHITGLSGWFGVLLAGVFVWF